MKQKSLFIGAMLVLSIIGRAQETKQLNGSSPASATIQDVSWIQGHWTGEAFSGTFEEIWSHPKAGAMMGMFRQISEEQISFYELITISEDAGSLVLRLKHFDPDLTAWEESDEKLECKLVAITKDAAYFEGYTFQRIAADHIRCIVKIDSEEVGFEFNRF